MAPVGSLSSAAPDPTFVAAGAARVDLGALADFGATAVPGAGTTAPVFAELVVAALTPPWCEHAPRPVLVEVVPSAQVTTATVAPFVAFASTFAALTSFFTTAFVLAVAFLLTPP